MHPRKLTLIPNMKTSNTLANKSATIGPSHSPQDTHNQFIRKESHFLENRHLQQKRLEIYIHFSRPLISPNYILAHMQYKVVLL